MNIIKNKVINRIDNLYNRKYDYYYIKSCFESDNNIKTLIAGSSYSCFGIVPEENFLCLGIPAEDFYYADKFIRKAIEQFGNVTNVILVFGYYSLYCDLSKTKSISEHQRIDDVYYPILHDRHNSVDDKKEFNFKSCIDDIIEKYLKRKYFSNKIEKYFNSGEHSREARKRLYWSNPDEKWSELKEAERVKAGNLRVAEHTRLLKYKNTYDENCNIIKKLYRSLQEKNKKLYVVMAPFTREYLENMSDEYKYCAFDSCCILRENCDIFYDFNDMQMKGKQCQYTQIYDSEYFVDTDHLSDLGAKMFTSKVKEIIG